MERTTEHVNQITDVQELQTLISDARKLLRDPAEHQSFEHLEKLIAAYEERLGELVGHYRIQVAPGSQAANRYGNFVKFATLEVFKSAEQTVIIPHFKTGSPVAGIALSPEDARKLRDALNRLIPE